MKEYSIPRQIWRAVWPALAFIGIQFAVSFAVVLIVTLTSGDSATAQAFATENTLLLTFLSFLASLAVFLPIWRATSKTQQTLGSGKTKAATVGLTALMFVAYNLVVSCLIIGTPMMDYFPSAQEVAAALQGSFPLQLVTICLLAPLVEELTVRGIILNRLATWTPIWVAVIASSLIFGLLHMNAFQTLNTTILGMLLGFVYVRTRNIWVPIIAHVANNTTSLLLSQLQDATIEGLPIAVIFVFSMNVVIFCGVVIFLLTKPKPAIEAAFEVEDNSQG